MPPSSEPSIERIPTPLETAYTWRYASEHEGLSILYAKAKKEQWDAAREIDWSIDVDPERENAPDQQISIYGSELWTRLTPDEVRRLRRENTAWVLSQFLHGEQGALLATAQLVDAVPWFAAKLYGSTQVVDEGRHVEVFSRYLREKITKQYPVTPDLKRLLDAILTDARWDLKYLGMQVLVEGLALAAFRLIHNVSTEPLLKSILERVMLDESRHVAFGVLSLRDFYRELPAGERRDRAEFAVEACALLRDRLVAGPVAETMGMPVDRWVELTLQSPAMRAFRKLLFAKVMPILKQLGLITSATRGRYEELGILEFENEPIEV